MLESNFIVNVRYTIPSVKLNTWAEFKDDTVGVGSYGTIHAAYTHKKKLVALVKDYKLGKLGSTSNEVRETLRGKYTFLKKNDARLTRAMKCLQACSAVRVLNFSLPDVTYYEEI